jgi:hypothetical protein
MQSVVRSARKQNREPDRSDSWQLGHEHKLALKPRHYLTQALGNPFVCRQHSRFSQCAHCRTLSMLGVQAGEEKAIGMMGAIGPVD